jgi:hypothetical protein
MLRYVLTVAGALAMISNVAFAEMGDGATTKVITRSAEPGMASKKVIIHRHDDGFGPSKKVVIKQHDDGLGATKKVVIRRHDDRYGAMVTKKKIIRHDNMSGSSTSGGAVVEKRTIVR